MEEAVRAFMAEIGSALALVESYHSAQAWSRRERRELRARVAELRAAADAVARAPGSESAAAAAALVRERWSDYKATLAAVLRAREGCPAFPAGLAGARAAIRACVDALSERLQQPTDLRGRLGELRAAIADSEARNRAALRRLYALEQQKAGWTEANARRAAPGDAAALPRALERDRAALARRLAQMSDALGTFSMNLEERTLRTDEQVERLRAEGARGGALFRAFSAESARCKGRRDALARALYGLRGARARAFAERDAARAALEAADRDLERARERRAELAAAVAAARAEGAHADAGAPGAPGARPDIEDEILGLERRAQELEGALIPELQGRLRRVETELARIAREMPKRAAEAARLRVERAQQKMEEDFPY
jgi:chromosome segregation ATPase